MRSWVLRSDALREQLFDTMLAHPILINRPIVGNELGTKLCRPSEAVARVRQWVRSLPIPIRVLKAAQPALVTPVLQAVKSSYSRAKGSIPKIGD